MINFAGNSISEALDRLQFLIWRTFIAFAALVLLVGCGPDASAGSLHLGQSRQIEAKDPRFAYLGRIDYSKPEDPVLIWQSSEIQLDFTGSLLVLGFKNARGQNFFDVNVDGINAVVGVAENSGEEWSPIHVSGVGWHHLKLVKRSEAAAGTVGFMGVVLDSDAKAARPAGPSRTMRILFLGDSITVGACNEDGEMDQWQDRRTHDGDLSYAAFTARGLGAELENISVSGMGVVTGWVPETVDQIWNRMYPNPGSALADLAEWTPDVVFINLGENDDSKTRSEGRPFPPSFDEKYQALVRAVCGAWPRAELVLLRGGMTGGATSQPLRAAWQDAVQNLERSDPAIHHYVFRHWTKTHPRVADDQAMADELLQWLSTQKFMEGRGGLATHPK